MDARLVMPRRTRTLGAVGTGLLAVLLAWSPVLAAVSWGSTYKASNDYAYSYGNALARTVTSGGTGYLHDVFSQDHFAGSEVTDAGPYLGIYYRRGNASGSTWGTARRLNSTSAHGDHAAIASSGKYVYATWRRQTQVATWNGVDPRPLQFRRNTNHGSSTAWQSQPTFLGADRIDYPALAATGSRVWIAYTDAIGGEIRLQESTNYGVSWDYHGAVGATTRVFDGGFSGRVAIAATGSTIAIAWDNGTNYRVKISIDAGLSWAVDTDLDTSEVQALDAGASSGRVAFAWVDGGNRHVYVRRFNGTALGAKKAAVTVSDATGYKRVNSPSITLTGTAILGIAYTACSNTSCSISSTQGTSVRWTESRNSGGTWRSSTTIGSFKVASSRRNNEHPSAIWTSSTRRVVLWGSFGTSSASKDRLLVRTGTGTP